MNVKLLKKVLAARDIKDPKLRKTTVDKIIQEQMEEDEKASPLYNLMNPKIRKEEDL